jgi:uncharacterized protein (DUF2345 family)
MATYPPNQTTPVKGSGNYLWNWLGTPLKKFAEALQPYVGGGDKLVAGSKELTLDSSGQLTLNSGNLTIISPDLDVRLQAQDDISIEAQDNISIQTQDRITLDAQNDIRIVAGNQMILEAKNEIRLQSLSQDFDSEDQGTLIFIEAGTGAQGNAANGGNGGNVQITAGYAGGSISGNKAFGGSIFLQGGYTTLLAPNSGGQVIIRGGDSQSGIEGSIFIGDNSTWTFNPNTRAVQCPTVDLATLGSAAPAGKRAIINDSTVAASGNFGAIAAGSGINTVPVFSDGTNWLIG